MNRILLLYALGATALLGLLIPHYRHENRRLRQNQLLLGDSVARYRTEAGRNAASVQVLRLRCGEYETLRAADAEEIRRLGIRIRRLEAAARSVTRQVVEVKVPVHDTVVRRDTVRDTVRLFRWRDTWTTVEGIIDADSVQCRVESVDTLRQVVHRVPRRFLFIRWGTKAIRQEITSSNPHTRIVHAEYVQFEK